jgi:hypothetical protein
MTGGGDWKGENAHEGEIAASIGCQKTQVQETMCVQREKRTHAHGYICTSEYE